MIDIGGQLIPGVFDPLIKRNTTIPTTAKKIYATLIDNQEKVRIGIYQGEENIARDNEFLGECELQNIPQSPAGKEKIEVEFSYDINGILKVKGIILSTGESINITLDTSNKVMTPTEKLKAQEWIDNTWIRSQYLKRINVLLENAEARMASVGEENARELRGLIGNLKEALDANEMEEVQKWEEALTDFLFNLG